MKVPTHQNNCNKRLYWSFIGAEGGSYIACNTYFVHPSSYLIGGIVNDTSEFADETNFWRSTINRKVAGMPMTITEYQHCHFNRFKHEAALTFPAYSALNDYDGLVVFDAAVARAAESWATSTSPKTPCSAQTTSSTSSSSTAATSKLRRTA